jgi:hypothetical protein
MRGVQCDFQMLFSKFEFCVMCDAFLVPQHLYVCLSFWLRFLIRTHHVWRCKCNFVFRTHVKNCRLFPEIIVCSFLIRTYAELMWDMSIF